MNIPAVRRLRNISPHFPQPGGAWLPARNATLAKHDVELVGMGITGIDTCSKVAAHVAEFC